MNGPRILGDIPLAELSTPGGSRIDLCVGSMNITQEVREWTIRRLCDALKALHATPCGFLHEMGPITSEKCPRRPGNLACAHANAYRGTPGDEGAVLTLRRAIAAAQLLNVPGAHDLPGVTLEQRGKDRMYPNIAPYRELQKLDIKANLRFRDADDEPLHTKRIALRTFSEEQSAPTEALVQLRDRLLEILGPLVDIPYPQY